MTAQVRSSMLRAAALITVLTVLARLAGFGRNLVFARTVGFNCLADTYFTVNTVPNVLYEIVAGGALASLVVPLLAGAINRSDTEHADRTASALLSWSIAVLAPLAVLVAVFAHPISAALLADKGCTGAVDVGASMLRVFAPQVVLYGIGVVLTGILQAHRRFGGPALAPLLSSLVVIFAYVTYGVLAPRGTDVDSVTQGQLLVLSVGTTLGVVVLSLSLLAPLSRTGMRLRPTLRFPAGVAVQATHLAAAGVAILAAQQISVVVALRLSNQHGVPDGAAAAFFQAQTIYLLPWAVLAVPVATSAFPRLSARWDAGDRDAYNNVLAASTRIVVLTMLMATASALALARSVARVIAQSAPGQPSVDPVADGIMAFSLGLVGYGLFACLSRALYASGRARLTAGACVAGWVSVIVVDLVLAAAMPGDDRVLALSLGNSVGMLILGVLLGWAVRSSHGGPALADVGRTTLLGVVAGGVGAAIGTVVSHALDQGGVFAAVGQSLVIGLVTMCVFAAVVYLFGRDIVLGSLHTLRDRAAEDVHD
jgi:putative peptidoglycan lipid II flippase